MMIDKLPYEYRVRWKPDQRPYRCFAMTKTFQTIGGARRHYHRIGPEPWRAWGVSPDDEFHENPHCDAIGGDTYDRCSCSGEWAEGTTWREVFADRKPPIYREIVRRPVGKWEPFEDEVVITDGRLPVAALVPVEPDGTPYLAGILAEELAPDSVPARDLRTGEVDR